MRSSTRWSALRAVMWKEWRENFKWALLISAAFALLLAYMVRQAADSREDSELVRLWQNTQPLTMFVLPLLSCALGFLQVNGELRRDGWAFLVHRPTSRGTIFCGKALSGLSLYALAATVPYLCFAWWMSAPGNVPAPFSWRLVWPGIALMTLGVPFYFAGMLTAIRAKPWFGSRALAIPAVLLAAMALSSADNWIYVVLFAIMYAMIAVAARGSFSTTGRWNGQGRAAQIALSSTVLAGLIVVTALAVGVAMSVVLRDKEPFANYNYGVTEQGQVFRSRQSYSGGYAENGNEVNLVDLKGRVSASRFDTQTFYKKNKVLSFADLQLREVPGASGIGSNVFEQYYAPLNYAYDNSSPEAWYFDHLNRRIVGHARRDKAVIGYIGSNGFHSNSLQVRPFDESLAPQRYYGWMANLLQFPHSVWDIDFQKRVVRRLFTSPQRVVSATRLWSSDPYQRSTKPAENSIALWTGDGTLHMLSTQGHALWSRRLTLPQADYTQLTVARNAAADRFWIFLKPYKRSVAESQVLMSLNSHGETIRQQTLPPFPANDTAPDWSQNVFLVAVPPLVVTMYVGFAAYYNAFAPTLTEITSGGSPEMLRATTIFLTISFLSAAFCSFLAWRRARRYAFTSSTRWAWTIGVFALGPIGYLLMRSLFDWPALEKCASCGKLRVVTRERCEHCGSSFAPPPPDGTEIVEPNESEINRPQLAAA